MRARVCVCRIEKRVCVWGRGETVWGDYEFVLEREKEYIMREIDR